MTTHPMTEPLPRVAQRITLRRLALADLARFQHYRHDPIVGQYQGWSPLDDTHALAFLRDMQTAPLLCPGAWCQLGIADRATGELIGDVGVCIAADSGYAEIGFILEHTSVQTIIAITDARNAASIRLLERLGMHLTETKAAVFKGEPCIEHTFVFPRP